MKGKANTSQSRPVQESGDESTSFITDFTTAIGHTKTDEKGLCLIKMLNEQGEAATDGTADYLFLKVNTLFEKLTGLENASGKKLSTLAPASEKMLRQLFHKLAQLHNPLHFEYYIKSEDRWLEVQGCCQAPQMLVWLKDISGRKRTEHLRIEQNRLMELIASGESMDKCLTELTKAASELASNTRAAVFLADESGQKLEHVYAAYLPPAFLQARNSASLNESATDLNESTILQAKPFTCPDIAGSKEWPKAWRRLYISYGLLSCHSEPVINKKGTTVASFMLCFNTIHQPTDWERQIAAFGTHIAALAIDRARTEEAVLKSKEKYQLLFNSIDEGFFIGEVIFNENKVPVDFLYIEANPASVRMTGTELEGKRTRELDPDFESHWYEIFGRVAQTGVGERHELSARPLGAFYNVYVFKVGEQDDTKVAAIYQDITERKQEEINNAFMTEIQDDLARLNSPAGILQTIGKKLSAFLNTPFSFHIELNEKQDKARVHSLWKKKDLPQIPGVLRISGLTVTDFNHSFSYKEPVVINDTKRDRRLDASVYQAFKIRAILGMPFHRDGKWKFILATCDSQPRRWRKDEIALFRDLANRVFPRLERAYAEKALRRSENRLSTEVKTMRDLYDSSTRLQATSDLHTALKEILLSSIRLMGAEYGNIQLYDPNREVLLLTVMHGFDQAFYNTFRVVDRKDDTACGRAARIGKRVVIEDIRQDKHYAPYEEAALSAGYLSVQTTPLYDHEGNLLGTLSTHWRQPHLPSKQDLRTLDLYARQATNFITRAHAEDQLRQSEAHLSAIFAEAEVGLSEITPEGHFLRVNDKLCRILGRSREEILQLTVLDVTNKQDVPHSRAIIKQLIETGKPVSLDKRYIRPDGELVWANSALSLLNKTEGNPRTLLAVTADITDRKILDRQKDEFIGIASHELKTPVTSIKIYAEILEENLCESNDKENARLAGKLLVQANRLTKLLNDLLDTTNIFEDRFILQPAFFNLNDLVKETVEALQPIASDNPLIIYNRPIQPVPADRERIAQVLTNLISNAIKYSPSGGKVVISSEDTKGGAMIRVKDSGIGMSVHTQKKVFNRFYRAGAPHINMNTFPGIGLGLFISSEIIKRHHGTIGVKSKPGEGSEFYFTLPYHAPKR